MESMTYEKTILQSLLEIDQKINLKYRESKLPKFLNKFFTKRARNKLSKAIRNYTDMNSVDRSELLYYVTQINDIYGGNFGHIKKIEHRDDVIIIAMVIPIEETSWNISSIISMPNNYDDMNITVGYSMFNDTGIAVLRFSNEFRAFMPNKEYNKKYLFPWKFEVQNNCVMDLTTETIIKDIAEFLDEMIQRSERISDDKLY